MSSRPIKPTTSVQNIADNINESTTKVTLKPDPPFGGPATPVRFTLMKRGRTAPTNIASPGQWHKED